MSIEKACFDTILNKLVAEHDQVEAGPMMSSPGIRYRSKVFAFYHDREMVFKLGKDFDPRSVGIAEYRLLNPFKNKPPLAGWFRIPFIYQEQWEALARQALDRMDSGG